MPGVTAAVYLLPETRLATVVLQNSLGLCDVADWASQVIINIMFPGKLGHDCPDINFKASQTTHEE